MKINVNGASTVVGRLSCWCCQQWSLLRQRLKEWGCGGLMSLLIGPEEKFWLNLTQNLYVGISWFHIFRNLSDIRILIQKPLNPDLKPYHTSKIDSVQLKKNLTSPMCQLTPNGTILQFVTLYMLWCIQYHKSDRGAPKSVKDWYHQVFTDIYWEMDHNAIDIQQVYLWKYLLMSADVPELQLQRLMRSTSFSSSNWII